MTTLYNADPGNPLYLDSKGHALEGAIYFGVPNLNPVTNPATVYWDAAGTQPAAQPVTVSNGRTVRSDGTPARVWISGDYSKLVLDSKGGQIDFQANQQTPAIPTTDTVDKFSGTGAPATYTLSVTPQSINNTSVFVNGVYQQKSSYTLVGNQLTITAAAGTNNVEVNTAQNLDWSSIASTLNTAAATAQTNATTATTQAGVATTQAANAAGSVTAINNRIYPGTYTTAPTTRPDGSARQNGDEYFDSTANKRFTYNGATWVASDINTANLAAPSGSSLVGTIQSGTGAVARPASAKLNDFVNIKDFGAKVDGVTDDLAALNAAVLALFTAGGGKLRIPKGYTRITGTWNIGSPEYTGYGFIVTRTVPLTSADYTTNTISANHTANQLLPSIDIEFEEGAFLVADFAPGTPTPALAYNLPFIYNNTGGTITNPTVISAAMRSGGKYNYSAVSTPQTNNIIGVYANGGAKVVRKPFVSGCQYGLVQANGYWSQISDPFVSWAGGRCVDISTGNAVTVSNVTMFDSAKGVVFDGGASAVKGIHTEQVAEDLTILAAECCEFGPGYIEDASTADGTGTYAVTLGTSANALQILESMFKGLRVGSARPNKGGYRIWSASNATFEACRAYGTTVTVDSNSIGALVGCDFSSTAPIAKFSTSGSWLSMAAPGSSYTVQGPWLFNVPGVVPGSIAAGASVNYDFTLPTSLNPMNNLAAFVSTISGGNDLLKVSSTILFTTPKKVRLKFTNLTASAIDPGTIGMTLGVIAGV